MEDGKIKLEQLSQVIDYMGKLTKKDLIDRMLNTPAKKLTAMKNQLILAFEAINDAGVLDLMVRVFEEAAKALSNFAKFVKENKRTFDSWKESIGNFYESAKIVFEVAMPYWKELVMVFTGVILTLNRTLAVTAARMLAAFIIPAAFAAGIILLTAAFIDLRESLEGKNSFFKDWSESDSGLIRFLSKTAQLLAEIIRYASNSAFTGLMKLFGYATFQPHIVDVADQMEMINRKQRAETITRMFKYGEGGAFNDANASLGSWGNGALAFTPEGFANKIFMQSGLQVPQTPSQQTNYVTVNVAKTNATGQDIGNAVSREMVNLPQVK